MVGGAGAPGVEMKKIIAILMLVTACDQSSAQTLRNAKVQAFMTSREVSFFYHIDTNLCFAKYSSSITNVPCSEEVLKLCPNAP